MKKSPYISIVIPLYNKEKSIVSTIKSVVAQTYKDWELIIVDDGSTDNSLKIVCERVREIGNERIKVIHQENAGVSAARNRGVREAKGDYVAFLDGDDIWEPTYLEEAAKLIHDYPNATIYGMGLGKMLGGKRYPAQEFIPANFRGVVDDLWQKHNTMLSWTGSSTICPRALALRTLANEHLTHGEDLDQWLRLMLQGDAVFYNKTLAYYVKDAENRAMYHMPPIDKHMVSIIDQYAEARNNNAAFRKAFDTQMIYFLYEYLFTPNKKEALRLAEQLDYSQLKRSMRFRMKFPYIYRFLKLLKNGKVKE